MDGLDSTSSFSIVPLPNEWRDRSLLGQTLKRYRDFRLQSLHSCPEAYASTYAWEVQFPEEVWEHRLQNKSVTHFIAAASRGRSEAETTKVQEEDWTGMIVLHEKGTDEAASASISPWNYDQSKRSVEEPTCGSPHPAIWYQLNGLFVHPSSRRTGVGRELIRTALAHVKEKTAVSGSASASAEVAIIVDTWNKGAIALYSSCGFGITREDEYDVKGSKRRAFLMSLMLYAHSEGKAS